MKTVLGIFAEEKDAENAINTLRENGYDPKNISIIMQDRMKAQEIHERTGSHVGEGAVSGVATGAVVGGIAGLLIGIGAIAIPGIGAILIGGPIAAALGLTGAAATTTSGAVTGALAGGVIGALIGLGVPKEQAKVYEQRIREGAILVAVPARQGDEERVTSILEDYRASDVNSLTLRSKYEEDPRDQDERPAHSRRTHHRIHDGHRKDDGHRIVNPVQVEKYLKHVDYPASKEDLIETAQDEGADENVIHTLDVMPDGSFNSPNDISRAIGRIG